jgi:hypothetical protein
VIRSRTIFAVVPVCLLLTGCPLTDHYRLQEDSLGAAGTQSSAGFGGDALASAGAGNAGEPSGTGGESSVCEATCNANRACMGNSCAGGWIAMAAAPSKLVARSKAASVAMGKAVFIWGGLDNDGAALDTGAIYYPATDSWKYLQKDAGSPPARMMATAVWTGSASNKVIVFGGTNANGDMIYRDGAVYDVTDNSWAPLPMSMSSSRRSAPYGYWDGTRAVFFGGLNALPAVVPGADRFDLKNWSVSGGNGDPGMLGFSAIAFDGSVMYLQGGVIGSTRQDKVFSYTSSTDTWASLSKSLSARTGAFGTWDGSRFVVWGGQDDDGFRRDGKTMLGTSWSDMTQSTVLSARRIAFRRSGWSFQVKPGVIAMIAGQTSTSDSGDSLATDGAKYEVQGGRWTAIPPWPSRESHEYGIGVWTGEEFVIWGGRAQNVSTLTGERWAP